MFTVGGGDTARAPRKWWRREMGQDRGSAFPIRTGRMARTPIDAGKNVTGDRKSVV